MIYRFRSALPPDVYKHMYREFSELSGILKRMAEGKRSLGPLKRDWEVTELMLSLVIFYRHVIGQFEGVERAMQQMLQSRVTTVRLGDTKISAEGLVQMGEAVRQFYGLVAQFQFPKDILLEHDVKQLATKLADYLKGQE